MIVVLMGAPGAGKGTQADLLVEKFGFAKISTGDALRHEIREKTDLGKQVSGLMEAGELVPDDLILEILRSELARKKSDVVLLDGYPRNVKQAETLQSAFADENIQGAVHIDVPTEELVERLSGRQTCAKCGASYHKAYSPTRSAGICDRCGGDVVQRPDDAEDKVKVRLQVYENSTKPVLDFYKDRGLYFHVDGLGEVDKVNSEIAEKIESLKN